MIIKVLFFAHLKDLFGADERFIPVTDGATVEGLVRRLLGDNSDHRFDSIPFHYAVNEDFVTGDTPLKDQDVLAILPPVSGG